MAKVSKEIVRQRPAEIVEACRKLYETMSFHEITLKEISKETSLSRPSIYNYFQTKEEIFLAILEEEYRLWGDDLEKILRDGQAEGAEGFAEAIACSLKSRETLLRIQSMHLYDIEENSRIEKLTAFKVQYGRTIALMDGCLSMYFPHLSGTERSDFIYEFYPFMYGVYPYAHPTEKQLDAMRNAGMVPRKLTVYEITRKFISDLLGRTASRRDAR